MEPNGLRSKLVLPLIFSMLASTLVGEPIRAQAHIEEVRKALVAEDRSEGMRRLERMGSKVVPSLWYFLSGQALEEGFDPRRVRAMAEDVFARLPAKGVVRELMAQLPKDAPLAERLALIEALSWTESQHALHEVMKLLTAIEPIQLRSRSVPLVLKRALPRLFVDNKSFRVVRDQLPTLPQELFPVLMEGLGELARPEVSWLFTDMVRRDPKLEPVLLRAIGLREQPIVPGASDVGIDLARDYLGSPDARDRRLAIMALGRLRDADSFTDLLELLDDENRSVQREAQKAIQELVGFRRGWNAERWSEWLAAEEEWLTDSSQLERKLVHGRPHTASEVLRELAQHRLFTDELVEIVARGLENSNASVRRSTCRDLATRRHPRAVDVLVSTALSDTNQEVRSAAIDALTKLTGLDLGPDALAWEAWWSSLS